MMISKLKWLIEAIIIVYAYYTFVESNDYRPYCFHRYCSTASALAGTDCILHCHHYPRLHLKAHHDRDHHDDRNSRRLHCLRHCLRHCYVAAATNARVSCLRWLGAASVRPPVAASLPSGSEASPDFGRFPTTYIDTHTYK